MPEVPIETLPIDIATRLTTFARTCKAAARAVSLYPPEHPAIGEALGRLAGAAQAATTGGPLALMVAPDNLLISGRATARPEPAITELAALLHSHLVGELTIHSGVEPSALRTLLGLMAEEPEALRTHGGIARALTTAGGFGIEIQELDYAALLRDRESGMSASWDMIIAFCLQKDVLDLDEKTIRLLTAIARDPAQLAEFFARAEEQSSSHPPRERTTALLLAMRGVTGLLARETPGEVDGVLDNMADAAGRLSPESLHDVVQMAREPGNEHASLAADITQRIKDATLARFVVRSVAVDRGCTNRLTDAFRALVPDEGRRKTVTDMAKHELVKTPFGAEPGFDRMWGQVERMLVGYSDSAWVSEAYDVELSAAHAHAGEVAQLATDPPERVASWLTTISDAAVRALDLQLLADLLVVETDAARRQELLDLVVGQIDELVALGDFAGARALVDGVASVGKNEAMPEAREQVTRAVGQLVSGQLMSQLTLHLDVLREEELGDVKAFCAAIGPALVPRLAEMLSGEVRPRSRQRLTELLIAFGKHGRDSVDRLRRSPNPGVRRTAVQLLRTFGGPEALADLSGMLDDTEPSVQREAVRALIGFGTEEAFERLQAILASEAERARAAVMEEMGSTRDPRATPLFCYLVRHVECRGKLRDIYLRSLGRLGLLGGTDAVAALSEALRKGAWWTPVQTREMRNHAAAALAQIKLPEAREALEDAAAHGSFGVRKVARKHL